MTTLNPRVYWRCVVVGVLDSNVVVVEYNWASGNLGHLEEVLPYDDQRHSRAADVLLSASEDQAELDMKRMAIN